MSTTPKRTLALSAGKKELLRKLKVQEGISSPEPALPLQPVPREDGALFPLSFAQQRLWLLDQLDPGTPVYNVPLALRLLGKVHALAFRQAISEIVRRHEALRTAFVTLDGVPSQKILPVGELPIPIIDLRSLSLNERRKKALSIVAEEAQRPFDLASGALLRAQLLQLDEDEYVLNLCMHHITSDAWSMEVFCKEMMALYTAFVEGKPSPLPELSVQYVDYTMWQRQRLQGEELEKQLSYWKQQLTGLPALLPLPTDRPRPAVQTFRGATTSFHLSTEVTAALKALSQREGASLFMTLLSAFKIWLYHHTGQADIAVGTPIANRPQPELERLIGFFINTLVLRTNLSGNLAFREVLQLVRGVTLDAFNHRETPFEMVVDALQVERNVSYSPLFQTLFTLQPKTALTAQQADFLVKPLDGENTVAKFDLSLLMTEEDVEEGSILRGEFEYNCDLFDATTIDRFAQRFITLLEAIVAQPDARVHELTCLPPAEQEQVLVTWNATHRTYGEAESVHQLFEAQVMRTPDAVALVFEDQQLSYQELDRRANQLANYLVKRGVEPEARVGLCIERSIDMVIGLLGVLKAGGAYVPLDPNYPAERIAFMIEDARIVLLLTHQSLLPHVPQIAKEVICLDTAWQELAQERTTAPDRPVNSENLAYVIYTSGSTGKPKGVMIPHRSLYNHMRWMQADLPLTEMDRVLQKTAFSFDASVWEFYAPLLAGAQLVLARPDGHQDSDYLIAACIEHGITILQLVPSVLRMLLEQNDGMRRCTCLRSVFCGGEELTVDLQKAFHAQLDIDLYNLYGPSETTIQVAYWRCVEDGRPRVPIGTPIANTRIYLLDAYGEPVPVGVPGELYIGGEAPGRGYLNRPDLTAERFVPDPYSSKPGARLYRSGDLARARTDGSLEYLGRVDHQVKVRGHRIEIGEIESILAQHPLIRHAVVVVHEGSPGNQYLVAYIVTDQDEPAVPQNLRQFLQARLPDYMLPTVYMPLKQLLLTANGKVDRRALPAPSMTREASTQDLLLPRSPLEEAVAEIWQQVLGKERIGIREDFFELGGHSLLGAQVISRIRAMLQVELPLRRLFETPTIEGLAQAIAQIRQEEEQVLQPPITRVSRDRSKEPMIPLSFAQQRLWILDRLDPGNATYNMPFAWNISGALNREALERSLSEIVIRHSILRTTFPIKDDTPVQHIEPAQNLYPLPFTDLRSLPVEQRPRAAERLLTQEASKPFNLATGPLWRTHLVCIDETTHVLFLCMHHIISDGWSLNIIRRELATLYLAFSSGQPSPLSPLHLQYFDYSIWQRRWLQGEVLERQLSYWKKQLIGAPDLLALPTDRPRGAVQNFQGASYQFAISPEVTAGLKALGQRARTTLFMTLLSAFQVLLNRYSNQDDLVVGTPIANRTHAETEDIIGFFVNTLALRTNLAGNPSFLEVLQRVRQTVLDAFAYQDLPFEQVIEAVQPQRDLAHAPLIQVMFTLQLEGAQEQEQLDLSPLHVSSLSIAQETAKFDLTLALSRSDHGLEGEFEYNTDLFDQSTIARMSEQFQTLLAAIVQNPAQSIARLPLLSPAAYQQIVHEWNATDAAYAADRLVFELVEEQAATRPTAPALWEQGKTLTYDELNRQANQMARVLQQQGVRPGCYVGVYTQRSVEMVVSLLAIFKAGAAYLPIDLSTPPARAVWMLNATNVALVLTQQDVLPRLADCQLPMLTLEEAWSRLVEKSEENLPRTITAQYPAYVIYTSGSTGTPKGVMVNHHSLLNLVFWHQQAFGLGPQDKTTQLANLGFDASVLELWPYLASGTHVHLVDEKTRLSPAMLVPWLVRQQITVCFVPTALVEMALQLSWPAFARLRLLLTGGEQLHRTPSARAPFRLMNQYGPTENTVVASWTPVAPGSQQNHLPTIGRAITNTRLYVLNGAGMVQPVGVAGELYIGGKSVAQGYLGRPDLTAERFVPDPFSQEPGARLYRTGDIVRFLPDGNLEFVGRRDHQVKIRGYRIELREIEQVLLGYPGVREAVVVVNDSLAGEKRLMAYIVPQEGVSLVKDQLRAYLKEQLPEYMHPSSLSLLDELPLTANGKVDRQALAQRRPISMATPEHYIAPRDSIELQLVQLWERLLGISPIGVTDNFFQLGGHSLAGVRLMSQIQRLFAVDLPLSTLFEGATIEHLAEVLRQQGGQREASPLVEMQAAGSQPPLFCVHAAGGEVLCYMSLAHHLGTERPVYGLQSVQMPADQNAMPSLVEMAARYIQAVRNLQPEGLYHLCGWSMGGVIAFEMARQLVEQGQQVAFLGLIDSYPPQAEEEPDERTLLMQFINDLAGGTGAVLSQGYADRSDVSADSQLEYLLSEAQRANILPSGVDIAYIRQLFSTFKKNREALSGYQIQPYAGRVTLFQASAFTQGAQVEITHGWRQFAAQIDEAYALPGDHYTILRDPHVAVLAQHISNALKVDSVKADATEAVPLP